MKTKVNKISFQTGSKVVKGRFVPYNRLIVRQKAGQSIYTASVDLTKTDARYLIRALASLIV